MNRRKKEVERFCSRCKEKITGKHKKRVNYPFGRKSKPSVTRICRRCQNPEKFDKNQEETNKLIFKVMNGIKNTS